MGWQIDSEIDWKEKKTTLILGKMDRERCDT